MSETQYNRRPVRMVELIQPRCALRFGTAPCMAEGTPKCYNTYSTCRDQDNYDPSGSIAWRFTDASNQGAFRGIGEVDGEHIKTPVIPCLTGTATKPTRLNLGAARDGESPFGVRSQLDVDFQDIPWFDQWGDYYREDRTNPNRGTYWAKQKARNEFLSGWTCFYYEGYAGQALEDMQQRLFLPEQIDGPDAGGKVSLRAADPLQLADRRRSLFPRPTHIILKDDITDSQTTVAVFSSEADITDQFGNTTERYIRAGDEIFSYTTATLIDEPSGEYSLTGITRGVFFTEATAHEENDTLQRVGRYENMPFWEVEYDLLTKHTPAGLKDSYIDEAQWDAEGNQYLGIFRATGTVPEPTPVTDLSGELCQQGLFSIWWDERSQKIPMLAVRPPAEEPVAINDRQHILPGATLKEAPEERLTRVLLYYGQRNPVRGDDPGNYARAQYRGEPDIEAAVAGGEVRTKTVFSRWIREDTLAIQFTRRLVARYLKTPRYLTISLDAKDRAIKVGTVLRVTTRTITDTEGNERPVLWQVISENEIKPGMTVIYDCQTYAFVGAFGVYMAEGSPVYTVAAAGLGPDERPSGAWYAGPDGKMSDESEGYQYQ